jgi:hypothetical protein
MEFILNTQKRKEAGRVFTLQNGFKKIDILQLKKNSDYYNQNELFN